MHEAKVLTPSSCTCNKQRHDSRGHAKCVARLSNGAFRTLRLIVTLFQDQLGVRMSHEAAQQQVWSGSRQWLKLKVAYPRLFAVIDQLYLLP